MMRTPSAMMICLLLVFSGASIALGSSRGAPADSARIAESVAPFDERSDAAKRVERVALDSAKLGLEVVALRCLELLERLGVADSKLEHVREQVQKSLSKGSGPPKASKLKSLTKAAGLAASAVVKAAQTASAEDAPADYGVALALDSNCEAAHGALDHVRGADGRYRSAQAQAIFLRRREIADAAQRARVLDVAVEVVPAQDPTMIALYGEQASAVRCEGLLIESPIARDRLLELVRASIRAMAFSNWLVHGKLEPVVKPGTVVHMPLRDAYHAYIQAALDADRIPAKYAKEALGFDGWAIHSASNRGRGTALFQGDTLVTLKPLGALGGDLVHRYNGALVTYGRSVGDVEVPHWLAMGHHNYVCLYFLGCTVPVIRIDQEDEETRAAPAKIPQGLRNAGLIGCSSWLKYLVREGRAPTLGRCVVEQEGMLRGTKLLRATSSAQWLAERDLMGELSKRCAKVWALQPRNSGTILQRTEAIIETSIPRFDAEWESWLLGEGATSVLDLIEDAGPGNKEDHAVLDYLNELRAGAGLGVVEIDKSLSRGAREHAVYLELHPEQMTEWPGAHMEYAESEGFSANGAWAGAHSVIAFNGSDACIDGWFGTFYHRVPLTHPGLLRVGFGSVQDTSVLDCTSLQDPTGAYESHYPFDGQTAVPRRFSPELPNPVPEREDQRTLGYPITYQLGPDWGEAQVVMRLLLKGEVVECFYSTPTDPTNPKIAPNGCYCLMPKEPLKAGAEYVVKVNGPAAVKSFRFKTGK